LKREYSISVKIAGGFATLERISYNVKNKLAEVQEKGILVDG